MSVFAPATATTLDPNRDPAHHYRSRSFWLEQLDEALTPRPPLSGDTQVDVAILGAGFSGLWTAYYLQARNPGLNIAIFERDIAGFGASGRNGGWCSSSFPLTMAEMQRRFGEAAARATYQAMLPTVDSIGQVAAHEGLAIDFVKGGMLLVAREPHQRAVLEHKQQVYQKLGFPEHFRWLSPDELAERVRIESALGALYSPHCAHLQPAKLARGLAAVLERRGVPIYEQTPVERIRPGRPASFVTPYGEVRATTLVLAGEAYLAHMAPVKRQILPLYSLIVLTKPLPESTWQQIGWQARECIASSGLILDYLARTADGRLLFGGHGAPYHFGSSISERHEQNQALHETLRQAALQWFPSLRAEDFSHSWGGVFGVSRDWMPTVYYDRDSGIASARGFGGQGVSTSNLAGRTLADLISGQDSELTALPFVNHRSGSWEPEPLRYAGVQYVQRSFHAIEAKAQRSGRPPSGWSLAELLGRH